MRHFGKGQLLHLFCGCKLWFGEMHHFGSSECFSNVLIKASPCCALSLTASFSRVNIFTARKYLIICVLCDLCAARNILSPLREGAKVQCCLCVVGGELDPSKTDYVILDNPEKPCSRCTPDSSSHEIKIRYNAERSYPNSNRDNTPSCTQAKLVAYSMCSANLCACVS